MDISFVIVNWNTRDLLLRCLKSIFDTTEELRFEVWLVDNASTDGSVTAAEKAYPTIRILKNRRNLGFAAANNLAFAGMRGRYAVLINTDARLKKGAIEALFTFMEETPKAAMACGQLLNEDGSKQNSIAAFPTPLSLISNETLLRALFPRKYPGKRKHYAVPIAVDSCIGACIMVRKSVMDTVGFLDERYFFFMEETDWAYRMKLAGWKIYFVPSAEIFHAQGKTVGSGVSARILFYRSRYQFFEKWHKDFNVPVRVFTFSRLLVNTLLNLLAVGCTFGSNRRFKDKLMVYTELILWHLRGCP
ncbi:MAG: glycosyltransferase family 2 protein [Deltaproteobacteria bacterium]|nr:glycosyltransferase family 2 protein [Deltaproteobacteria bacterium]